MTNIDPGAPEYEFDWQNPNKKNAFDFGRTFTRTIDILKIRGLKMMAVTAVLMGFPIALISLWPMFMGGSLMDLASSNDADVLAGMFSGGVIAMIVIGGLLTFIASLWVQPALIEISYGALTRENPPAISVLKGVTRFVLPVFGFYILYIFAVMIGMVLLIIPGILIGLGWMLAGHIIVLEGQGVTDSISRAWSLTKGYKRWLFLLAIVFGVIGAVIGALISIPLYLMGDPTVAMLEGASSLYWILNAVISTVGQVVGTVLGVAWGTSSYVELRKVREGIDPESQVDVFS